MTSMDDRSPAADRETDTDTEPTRATRDDSIVLDRRAILKASSVGAAVAVAGCLSDDDTDGTDESTTDAGSDDDAERTDDGDDSETGDDGANDGADGDDGDDEADGGDDDADEEDVDGHALPFEDDMLNTDNFHEMSDLDNLGVDTSSEEEMARPEDVEEETDPVRMNRESHRRTPLVFQFAGDIEGVRAEAHFHGEEQGVIRVAVSPDGDEWTELEDGWEVYNEAHGDEDRPGNWWENAQFKTEEIDDGMRFLRFMFDEGGAAWTPQLGHVEVW